MSEGIDEPLFYTDALGNIMVKYKGLSFHPKAYHSLMSMPTAREQELEKENEELKAELKKVITHYQCQTLAVRDRLAISNCSDIELSDAYDKLDLSETWLKENYSHMKLDWF